MDDQLTGISRVLVGNVLVEKAPCSAAVHAPNVC